ncbi:MAG: hypothetical protein NT154_05930, partial [Verrucomicrobia bacterium]|nr:hypothetical protein [Verrucomicrobiota bacterium]
PDTSKTGKSATSQASKPAIRPITLARMHWLGKKQIAAQKTSGYFMSIWNLPEAARLETQTLDKLALALAGGQSGGGSNQLSATGNPSSFTNQLSLTNSLLATQLRPLLNDLVRDESYMELQQVTNQPGELALAVQLDAQRAELWTSNLTAVLEGITNVQSLPAPASRQAWRFSSVTRSNRLDLARVGDWTLLGLATETNRVLAEFSHRILADHTPVSARQTDPAFQKGPAAAKVRPAPASPAARDYWLDADLDLRGVVRALSLGWKLPDAWPRIAATWMGRGDQTRTTGKLTFAQPLKMQLEPWNTPTNLIRDPLVSFSAVRGVHPWLAGLEWLKHFQIEPVPDQLYAWASGPAPMLSYLAAPMTNAEVMLQAIGPRIQSELNPWFTNNAFGVLEYSNGPVGLNWSGIPMFTPAVEAATNSGGSFLLGRFGPLPPPGAAKLAPPELFAQLTSRPNIVYYDWEITQPRLEQWVYLSQTARLAFVRPQMSPKSAAFAFLLAVASKLGNSGTEIILDGPSSMSFIRNSHSGFTAVELHFLADWLESPAFPRGLHSLLAPKPPKWRTRSPGTNSIPPTSSAAARGATKSPGSPR